MPHFFIFYRKALLSLPVAVHNRPALSCDPSATAELNLHILMDLIIVVYHLPFVFENLRVCSFIRCLHCHFFISLSFVLLFYCVPSFDDLIIYHNSFFVKYFLKKILHKLGFSTSFIFVHFY